MSKFNNIFRLTAVSVALASVFGTAWSDDEVAELIKPDSSISVGVGAWDKDRRQGGIYDGMRDNGTYGLFDADIVRRNDDTGTWMKFRARNLGLENRELSGEYLRQGDWGVSIDYNRLTRDNPYTFTTGLQGIGSPTQIVSAAAPKRIVYLGTAREGLGFNVYKNLAYGLDFNLSAKAEEKTGSRQWGRGGAAEFAVEPINSVTRQVEGVLSYTSKTFQLSGGYYGSWYDNRNSLVTVFTNTLGNAPTYLSQPLDNQAHQIYLNGGYTISQTTRATMKLSYTRATQNESLPTKDIAGLSLASSPQSLNGEVNTTLAQFALTSRPTQNFSFLANLRYHGTEDKTPVARYVQTNPACGAGQCVDNSPFSYKTYTGKLEGTYRLGDGFGLTAGFEDRYQDRVAPVSNSNGTGALAGADTQRVVPMRSYVNETTWRLELRRSLSDVVNGSLAYLFSQRVGSNYLLAAGAGNSLTNGIGGTGPSNLISPINIADRDRHKLKTAVEFSPMNSLSLQFNVELGMDNYDHDAARPYGLQDGYYQMYSLDMNYALSNKWSFNAWASFDVNQAKQANSRLNNGGGTAVLRKDYDLKDTGTSLGLGFKGEPFARTKLGADLQWYRNTSHYGQDLTTLVAGTITPANYSAGLADITNKMLRINAYTTYSLAKNADLRFDLIHERWATNDWTWSIANGSPFVYSSANDGTTVTSQPRQNATFAGVRYIYKF